MDFDDDVLYCYEIQLEESCRGKGLGKFMMKVLNIICARYLDIWMDQMQYVSSSETLIFFFLNTVYKILELLTIKAGLLKTMLTVFKHNTKASTFFKEVNQ